ncbi:MAG: hypothetical protein J2P34_06315 [Actinobacteria bacterium]|nr:hypothetical protein [Actinomycetota bacterium]
MPVIGALSELAAIVGEHEEVYLRHSLGPAADRHQSSRDYESGLELPGLSVVPLSPPQWWRRPVTDWLARQICKYAHLSQRDSRRYPWVLTGPVTGAGPDQEPLVADPLPLGRLSDQVLAEARQRYHERFQVGRESPD